MNDKELEYRMYFLVMYNLAEIQKGIQAGHAALEYAAKYSITDEYKRFMNDKTWIILNGGTSNEKGYSIYSKEFIGFGSMEQSDLELVHAGINHSVFVEPDLNNSLSAICFLADERVFNKKDYPDFVDYYKKDYPDLFEGLEKEPKAWQAEKIAQEKYPEFYDSWIQTLGGPKNHFLREFLKTKRLA